MNDFGMKKKKRVSTPYFIIRQQQYESRREAHLLIFNF